MALPSTRRTAVAGVAALVASALPLLSSPASAYAPADATVFINELHYDNDGTDAGELVEVAGPVGTDLTGWQVVAYNGNGGTAYSAQPLTGVLADGSGTGHGFTSVLVPGLQNGSPDGVALVDAEGDVVQLLSYEGVLTATSGPAAGRTSTDIGATEGASTPVGASLQLTGTGTAYGDFTWTGPVTATAGTVNAGQVFGPPGPDEPAGPVDVVPISAVQGAGASSPLVGQTVSVEAVVTSLITTDDALSGFFVQEEDADADGDTATSEGVFVFCGSACPEGLAGGDLVQVTGTVGERFESTQINASGVDAGTEVLASGLPLPTAAGVTLPAGSATTDPATFEEVEGMRTTIATTLVVSEYFELARFGEVVLTAEERPYQYTQLEEPSVEGYAAHLAELATRRIVLDDDSNDQNDATSGPLSDEPYYYPTPGLSTGSSFRGGDTITGLTGVFEYSFGEWKLRPVAGQEYVFEPANPRPQGPDDVGGRLTVASFNVLNYFATIDTTASRDVGDCGPSGTADCRGADSEQEREQQLAKIVAALRVLDADVLGLIEIQNDEGVATQQVVDALNAATAPGTYASIDTGFIGTDAIKQAFLYRTATVAPVGDHALLTQAEDARFLDERNRPALIQTFEELATGERVTVAVNHFKSKGSDCGEGDDSPADGSGNCDATRTAAAQALADYLATDPTGSGDPDFLIIGDLNSYSQERPITALEDAGYVDLLERFEGLDSYGYVFDGALGHLDHALATPELAEQVTGAGGWTVNADEIPMLDYNDTVRDTGESSFERESAALPLYEPSPYRSSDHDPVVVGLDLGGPLPVETAPEVALETSYQVRVGRDLVLSASGTDADGDALSFAWDLDGDGAYDDATGEQATLHKGRPPGRYLVSVQVSDGELTDVATTQVAVVTPGRGTPPGRRR